MQIIYHDQTTQNLKQIKKFLSWKPRNLIYISVRIELQSFLTDTIAVTFAGSPILSMTRRITVVLVSLTTNSVCPANLISVSPNTKGMNKAERRFTNKNVEGIPMGEKKNCSQNMSNTFSFDCVVYKYKQSEELDSKPLRHKYSKY